MQQKNKVEINYLFYGFVFLFLSISTITNTLSVEKIQPDFRSLFIFHCIGQSLLEICLLIIAGYLLEKFFPKLLFPIFIGAIFLLFLIHIIDFILIRIMDLSIWNALGIVMDETLPNFIEMLILTGVPLYAWIMMFLFALLLPVAGFFFFKLMKKLSYKKPFLIQKKRLLQCCFSLILSLFLWDLAVASKIRPEIYSMFKKSLPWKTAFLSLNCKTITLKNCPICHLLKKGSVDELTVPPLPKKPNIYIFIIESLREDFITPIISPSIYNFKKENISFDLTLSNSNNTHCSWFSLLYSQYPFYWAEIKKGSWTEGSIPLNILKKAGYKINVLTSSGLHYYRMDELLFGKKQSLLNSLYVNSDRKNIQPYKSDKIAIDKVIENMKEEGNIFLIFLESTHFDYSWPPDRKTKFQPITKTICSSVTYPTKQLINGIKNRYKNSLNYVDSLFDLFLTELKKKNLYDDSIIVLTGDHGEEFFEKGRLFHASHLSHVQTNTPIYYKLGNNKREIPQSNLKLTSHIDIFPTLLDYLFNKEQFSALFNGRSLFCLDKFPYVISTRYNASRTPYEFFVHNGKNKVILKFNKKDIFHTKGLQIISIRNLEDEMSNLRPEEEKFILDNIKSALDKAFSD